MNIPPSPHDPIDDLFAQACRSRPETVKAEFAFETRLLARLRSQASPFTLSWRMIPYLAFCVIGLALWQIPAINADQDSEQTAYLENQQAVDLLSSLN